MLSQTNTLPKMTPVCLGRSRMLSDAWFSNSEVVRCSCFRLCKQNNTTFSNYFSHFEWVNLYYLVQKPRPKWKLQGQHHVEHDVFILDMIDARMSTNRMQFRNSWGELGQTRGSKMMRTQFQVGFLFLNALQYHMQQACKEVQFLIWLLLF